jgi:hypothetical protein
VRVVWQCIAIAIVILPAFAAAAPIDPEPKPFPAPGASDKGDGSLDQNAKRQELQNELLSTLKKLGNRIPPSPVVPPPKPKWDYPPPSSGKSIDQLREGMNLFRDNYFEAAQRTFYAIEPSTLQPEDRAFAKYMLASSLRRLKKMPEAIAYYQEVANTPDDEFLSNCAISQLALIRSNQELEAQLEQLRSRAKTK